MVDTLPMPGLDAPEPRTLVEPKLDPAAVSALADQLAAGTAAGEADAREQAAPPTQEPAAHPQWPTPAPVVNARPAPDAADAHRAMTIGQGEGGNLSDLWHIVDLVEDRVDALSELVRAAKEAPESVRRELTARVDALVAALDPAVASRLAPLREELRAVRGDVESVAAADGHLQRLCDGIVRRLNALEQRNPDAADFNGKVRDVLELVESLRATMPSAVRALFDQWRAEASAYAPPAAPAAERLRPAEVRRESSALGEYARGDALPTVRFEVLARGVQHLPVQNSDGSIGLRLNLNAGAQYPMAELTIPQTGAGHKPVDFGYAVHVPPGWLADVTCAPSYPDRAQPQQRAYLTTLHGSTPPGQTLVLNLHCTEQARGIQSGTEVVRLHLRRVEPAAFEVSDGVSKPTVTRGDARDEIEALRRENEALRAQAKVGDRTHRPDPPLEFGGAARDHEGPRTGRYGTGERAPADPWTVPGRG